MSDQELPTAMACWTRWPADYTPEDYRRDYRASYEIDFHGANAVVEQDHATDMNALADKYIKPIGHSPAPIEGR